MDIYDPSYSGSSVVTPGDVQPVSTDTSDISRVLPRQLSTGTLRGTQNVGYGGVKIDGSNDIITVTSDAGNTVSVGGISANLGTSTNAAGFGVSILDKNRAFITMGLDSSDNAQLVFNDATANRLLAGKQPTFGEGFFVSKAGKNVLTTTSASDFIFNSNQNVFKIVQTGNGTLPSSGAIPPSSSSGTSLVTVVPHNLGYVPIAQVYANMGAIFFFNGTYSTISSYTPLPLLDSVADVYGPPNPVQTGTSFIDIINVWFAVDATNLYVQVYFTTTAGTGTTTSGTIPFKYYLLQETAN